MHLLTFVTLAWLMMRSSAKIPQIPFVHLPLTRTATTSGNTHMNLKSIIFPQLQNLCAARANTSVKCSVWKCWYAVEFLRIAGKSCWRIPENTVGQKLGLIQGKGQNNVMKFQCNCQSLESCWCKHTTWQLTDKIANNHNRIYLVHSWKQNTFWPL